MRRTVAQGIDVIETGAAELVDPDPVCASRPCGDQWCDRRNDADSDDDHLAGDRRTVCQPDTARGTRFFVDAFDRHACTQIDAVRPVLLLVEPRQFLASDARENAVLRLEHGDGFAKLGEHRRGFKADIAATDHDHASHRRQFGDQAVDVGARADGVNTTQVVPGTRQSTRLPTGRPDELAVGNRRAIGNLQRPSGGIHRVSPP